MKIKECQDRRCPCLARSLDKDGRECAWMCTHGSPDGTMPAPGWHPAEARCEADPRDTFVYTQHTQEQPRPRIKRTKKYA